MNLYIILFVYIVKPSKGSVSLNAEKINEYVSIHGNDLSRFCLFLCRNQSEAEDLYQDTWVKVIKKIDSYNSDKPFDKWVLSICSNTYKDKNRLHFVKKRFEFASPEDKQLFFDSIPDKSTPKEDYFELFKCLSMLTPKFKEVLVLKFIEGYSEIEVASILGIPNGTVKSRLNKAKQLLRGRLEKYEKSHR
ncbi:MAG: polymerase sigma factor [Bacillales bacterium]|nr:polymerase sigma factor [Bacillales bacterium]